PARRPRRPPPPPRRALNGVTWNRARGVVVGPARHTIIIFKCDGQYPPGEDSTDPLDLPEVPIANNDRSSRHIGAWCELGIVDVSKRSDDTVIADHRTEDDSPVSHA